MENGKTWPEQFRETLFFWTDKLEGGEFEDLADKVEDVVENNLDLIDGVDRPVLVHREIDTKNILVKDGELNAILDWENCMAGHGELDLVITEARMIESSFSTDKVWEKYRKELYGGYREIRALEDGWRERRQLYLLFPFVWEMAFYPDSGSNSEETIRRRVEEVLQSLEN